MTSGTLTQKFKPAWWLPDGHSQTLWRKITPPASIDLTRQRVELSDGDFIDLDWAGYIGQGSLTNKAIVIILHGLCGCSSSPYVTALQSLLRAHNIPTVAMNFRGCSGEMNRLARTYHSGVSEDVNEVFSKMIELYPQQDFNFVGYSLGANVLLKWSGEIGSHSRVKKAVAVSTPFSLAYCSQAMLRGVTQLYGRYFVRRLLRDIRQKKQHFEANGESEQLQRLNELGNLDRITTIWEFDDQVTAPLHGFKNADDYYRQCSSIDFIPAIRTETLLIQSQNDPMIPAAAVPEKELLAANIELQLSAKGGHVGFISGSSDNWLEHRILGFFEG